MSGLKTLLVVLLVSPVSGLASGNPLAVTFASCAGRLSAEIEHAWLIGDDRAGQLETRRARFVDLVNASATDTEDPNLLNRRIEAKVAHAQLLSLVAFSPDADRSAWALQRVRSEIAYCAGFLLES